MTARQALIRTLQLAYSGELGAIRAYLGHARSLRGKPERALIARILRDEIRHRWRVLAMLTELGAAPDEGAERKMTSVGRVIACVCRVSGFFIPMYGAAKLELDNIAEYELAARQAHLAGCPQYEDDLIELAEVEWDHEAWLRECATRHWAWRVVPKWKPPAPRAAIRARFEAYLSAPGPVVRGRKWLVR